MKNKLLIPIILLLCCFCKNNKDSNLLEHAPKFSIENININDSLSGIFKDYISYLENDPNVIFQVFIEQTSDSTGFILTYTPYKSRLKQYMPDAFYLINNRLFLLYSGLNKIGFQPSVSTKFLEDKLSQVVLYDEMSPPRAVIFNYLSWYIRYNEITQGFRVTKKLKNPYNLKVSVPRY